MKENRFRTLIANVVILSVLGILSVTVGLSLGFAPSDGTTEVTNTAIYRGNQEAGAISLMVNVYEGTEYALQISSILDAYGFDTTFFVGGKWVERNSTALVTLAASGNEIGNHGYLHRDHAKLNAKQNQDEILVTEKLISATLASLPDYLPSKLFAPPSGSYGNTMFEVCKQLDYTVVMWSRDTIDWRDHDAELIYSRAVKNLAAGDLILMHPTAATVKALPRILDYVVSVSLRVDTVTSVIG